jgi:hypothetical protein
MKKHHSFIITVFAFMFVATSAQQIIFEKQPLPVEDNSCFYYIDAGQISKPTFVDIDNDGDLDCFSGEFNGYINYYENIGTNTNPGFEQQTGANNPLDLVQFSMYIVPTFADLDNDGDFDAIIGEASGYVFYYKNTGDKANPVFELQTGANDPFLYVDVESHSAPAFTDIDSDGDFDVFIGEGDGIISYYENTGNNTNPVFQEQTGANNPANSIDVGVVCSPTFIDIENDGDFDLFCGGENGTQEGILRYYENIGNSTNPDFQEQTGANNPLNIPVDAFTGYFAPAFADIDNDGDYDAFLGTQEGIIRHYENKGNNTNPNFVRLDIDVGREAEPTFVDIDGDGDFDVFFGSYPYSYIKYYKNTGDNVFPAFEQQFGADNPLGNVTAGFQGCDSKVSFVDIDNDDDFDAFIGFCIGNYFAYYKNIGSNTNPEFQLQTGANDPFNNIELAIHTKPTFVDIDNDDDFDAFISQYDDVIKYYKNTGNSTAPVFEEQSAANNPFDSFSLGTDPSPTFTDIDNDGDFDAFVGAHNGYVKYCKNIGNGTSPVFEIQTGVNNPLNVNVGFSSSPAFVDIDNDGDTDAFIGNHNGIFIYYKNFSNAQLTWSGTVFSESPANDGSISTIIDLTIYNETFVIDNGVITDFISNNVPDGLLVLITATSNTTATIQLTGNAINHENADNVSNMEITFTDGAFTGGDASAVTGYSQTNLSVDFDDLVNISTDIEHKLSIYPNPSNGIFTIKSNYKLLGLKIKNIAGKTIYSREHVPSHIDLTNRHKGVYFMKIKTEDSTYSEIIIIQ